MVLDDAALAGELLAMKAPEVESGSRAIQTARHLDAAPRSDAAFQSAAVGMDDAEGLSMLGRLCRVLAVGALLGTAACAGTVDEDDNEDFVIDESEAALTSPDVDGTGGPGGDEDRDCTDDDRDGHKRHKKHKWKVLDRLDGAKDKTITIASLPPGLPDRLLTKLHKLDANSDGLVTRDEIKAHKKNKKSGKKHDKKDSEEHDD